jgi:hypothetical protein
MTEAPEKFAKLFDTPHGQLLVTIDFDDDADCDVVTLRCASRHGVVPAMKMSGWDDDTGAAKAFAAIEQEHAENHARSLAAMLDGLMAEQGALLTAPAPSIPDDDRPVRRA